MYRKERFLLIIKYLQATEQNLNSKIVFLLFKKIIRKNAEKLQQELLAAHKTIAADILFYKNHFSAVPWTIEQVRQTKPDLEILQQETAEISEKEKRDYVEFGKMIDYTLKFFVLVDADIHSFIAGMENCAAGFLTFAAEIKTTFAEKHLNKNAAETAIKSLLAFVGKQPSQSENAAAHEKTLRTFEVYGNINYTRLHGQIQN
ncbi:MAG: hypothetical protein LBN23_06725 [Paludibacter sp.]|nr:hypothetical protein [Paludibacter sp.]